MSEESRTPSMAEVIRAGVTSALAGVHTAMPARVTRYDPAKQQADVQPLIRVAREDEEGNRVAELMPVVRNCPVHFSGGGGLVLSHPVAVGDLGLVVFAEGSLDKWLGGSGADVDPDFDARHALTDGVFIPGVRPFGAARATDPGSAVCIGTDGGAFQGAALGQALQDWLGDSSHTPLALVELMAWLANHGHSGAGAGPPTTQPPNPPTLKSNTVKITP